MQKESEEKKALAKEEKEKQAKQEQQCNKVKKQLSEMRNASFLYEKTDDPLNPRIVSDKEREEEQNKYQEYLDEHCQ